MFHSVSRLRKPSFIYPPGVSTKQQLHKSQHTPPVHDTKITKMYLMLLHNGQIH